MTATDRSHIQIPPAEFMSNPSESKPLSVSEVRPSASEGASYALTLVIETEDGHVAFCFNEAPERAHLLAASYNSFQTASEKLNIPAIQLAKNVDVAELIEALRDYREALQDGPENMAYSTSENLCERADALLAKLPTPEVK